MLCTIVLPFLYMCVFMAIYVKDYITRIVELQLFKSFSSLGAF